MRVVAAVAILAGSLVAGAAGGAATATAAPQARDACVLTIDGQDIAAHRTPGSALRLNVHDVIAIDAVAGEATSRTTIAVDLPVGPSIPITTIDHDLSAEFHDDLSIDRISTWGVGWYHIAVDSGACHGSFWVRVYGRSPLTTVIGIIAIVVAIAGVALVVLGFRRGRLRHRGWVPAALGGIVLGLGLCVLAQQYGLVAFTAPALGAFLGGGAVASVAGNAAVTSAATSTVGTAGSSAGAGGASAAAPPPPPGPARPPPLAAAPPAPPTAAPGGVAPPAPGGAAFPAPAMPATGAVAVDAEHTADPPRTAYARISAPEVVVVHREMQVVVGLAVSAVVGVVAPRLVRPTSSVGAYTLDVQLVADGFSLRPGESWRRSMLVTARDPYPSVVFDVTADGQDEAVHARSLQVFFSVDSQTMGLGVRSVAVVADEALLATTLPGLPAADLAIAVPTDVAAPDLTVRVLRGDAEGRLLWTFESPHDGATLDHDVATDIGPEPAEFARLLLLEVAAHEHQPTLGLAVRGIGRTIADAMPAQFWSALGHVGTAVAGGHRPTLLLLSDEPYVPWELAAVDAPIDGAAAPFLGAQVTMGRWVLGSRRPALPPPTQVTVSAMAVVSGVYERPGWSRLIEAEKEAADLAVRYHATAVDAVTADVVECLAGRPVAQALHFSMHGRYDPTSTKQGLILVDGNPLDPFVVKGAQLTAAPFVFLNACQVGSGNEVLGDYSGMAAAFLYAGAAAVVAPLWSIDDGIARRIAERFYEQAFGGAPPAEIIRAERGAFGTGAAPTSSTCLAYQFFGHPALRLRRDPGRAAVSPTP